MLPRYKGAALAYNNPPRISKTRGAVFLILTKHYSALIIILRKLRKARVSGLDISKYGRCYGKPPKTDTAFFSRDYIAEPPLWCSVDLRDGNQALDVPMSLSEKLEFFNLLVRLGFKEIEVGFPAASDTEFEFIRELIEGGKIPDDVTIQVLTIARENTVRRTFEALRGAKSAIVHMYNSTARISREAVFSKSREELTEMAADGARLCLRLKNEMLSGQNVRFEYSPENFTTTEIDYSIENLRAVAAAFEPTENAPLILNLPATVESSMPNVYAMQVRAVMDALCDLPNIIFSLHPHNDRGCAVADAEMCLLAGVSRVEGTLFGNGERTGNLDLITLALNMFAQGVEPKLDLSNLPEIVKAYERLTGMEVPPRHPYAGALVFAAFSGTHQDAIAKGMRWQKNNPQEPWRVPYLPIDPADIGRGGESDIIRINSQSGKSGVGYLLENNFGYDLPKGMREDVGRLVKRISDRLHKELTPNEVLTIFRENYIDQFSPLDVIEAHFKQHGGILATITVQMDKGATFVLSARGNGRLDAVSNALSEHLSLEYKIEKYQEHALATGSDSRAISYVGIMTSDGKFSWGAGTHNDIMASSVNALVSAINRLSREDTFEFMSGDTDIKLG